MKDLSVFAQATLSALARGKQEKLLFWHHFPTYSIGWGDILERKRGKLQFFCQGAVSMKRRSAFIFPVLPPVLFTERRQQQWASWLNASHLFSPPHTLLAWERSAVWNRPGGALISAGLWAGCFIFHKSNISDHSRWEEPLRFWFSEGISHALAKSALTTNSLVLWFFYFFLEYISNKR